MSGDVSRHYAFRYEIFDVYGYFHSISPSDNHTHLEHS